MKYKQLQMYNIMRHLFNDKYGVGDGELIMEQEIAKYNEDMDIDITNLDEDELDEIEQELNVLLSQVKEVKHKSIR